MAMTASGRAANNSRIKPGSVSGLADTRVEDEVAAFDEAKLRKFRQRYLAGKGFGERRIRKVPEAVYAIRLRPVTRNQRPCGRASHETNKSASFHLFAPSPTGLSPLLSR